MKPLFYRPASHSQGYRKFARDFLHYLKRGYRCSVAWRLARKTL